MEKAKLHIDYLKGDTVVSHREVDQELEFKRGPLKIWQGNIRITATLRTDEDVEGLVDYVRSLRGDIQVPTKPHPQGGYFKGVVKLGNTRTIYRPKPYIFMSNLKAYQQIVKDLKTRKSMEEVVEYLRECNFRVVNYQFLEELDPKQMFRIKGRSKKFKDTYVYMVRVPHINKDATEDVYDTTLIVGLQLFGVKRKNRFFTMLDCEGISEASVVTCEWKRKENINFKEKKILVTFPTGMSIQDRIDWRRIRFKLMQGKEVLPAEKAFHDKWEPLVQNLEEYEKRLDN